MTDVRALYDLFLTDPGMLPWHIAGVVTMFSLWFFHMKRKYKHDGTGQVDLPTESFVFLLILGGAHFVMFVLWAKLSH